MRTCLIRKVAIDVHLPREEAGSNRRTRGTGLRANRSLHCRAVHVDASVVHLVRGPESAELIAELFIASAPSRAGLAIAPARETVADGARIIIMLSTSCGRRVSRWSSEGHERLIRSSSERHQIVVT